VASEPNPDSEHWPDWADLSNPPNANLPNLLSLASGSYERHIGWFLRHSDTGIRNLGAVIAAETAIVGLYFTHFSQKDTPQTIICVLSLLALALVVAPSLCSLATRSTTQAYSAAMESVRLITKCVWAMGLTSSVAVNSAPPNIPSKHGDRYLYPKRWTEGPLKGSELEFIEHCLRNRKGTYFLTMRTLQLICAVGVLLGCGSAAAIILR
jgi:hypothetical protein